MNKYLMVGVAILSIIVVYLIGRVQVLSEIVIKEQNQDTPVIVPTTIPTDKPKVIYKTPTVVATPTPSPERKKVSLNINLPNISGTYYCYEDKVNLITHEINMHTLAMKGLDNCSSTLKVKISSCDYNDPSTNCPTGNECDNYSQEAINFQKKVSDLVYSHCPMN